MDPSNTMYVTYVEKYGAFVKIWGQIEKDNPIAVENYLAELKPQFDQGHYTLAPSSIQVGLLCCAKYKDDMYYRARVTNVSALYQNFVEVHFIDYGNKDMLSVSALRSGVELSYVLVSIPNQAHEFILANVTHIGLSWENSIISTISNEIRYMNLPFTPLQQITPFLTLIKLFKNNEDYALSLFNRGYVLCMASVSQNMILQNINLTPAQPISPPQQSFSSVTPPQVPPGVQTVQAPPPAVQSTATLLSYKGHTINPGTEHNVYVSYVSDGPCHFSVQLQRLEENLAKLMRELNRMELEPLEEHPLPGTVCLAKCVEDDNICRAVITSMSNNEAKVFYVDFGNTEVVANERLFQIPIKFVIMRVMSTRYCLAGLENTTVTLEMKCAFKEFVSDKLLTMHSLAPPAKYALPLCILWDSNKNNALDVMKKVALMAYPEVIALTRGFCQEVIVSYVYSCSHFYVQLKSKEEELRKLMEELQLTCPNAQPINLSQIKQGLPVCALFDTDGQWYRGEVISTEEDIVKVRYVDYGNEELVNIVNLRIPVGDSVTVLRPQALECCLNGYQNMADDMERDTILEELILEKEFTMRVIEMQSSRALVDLIDNSRYNVGSLLLERLAVARSQVSPLLIQDSYQIEQRKRQSPISPNNKYERKNSRDTINDNLENEPDRGVSRKNLNNQINRDSRNRESFRQDSNRAESTNDSEQSKQEWWRQDRGPRKERNDGGGGWNTKSDEWNSTAEDRPQSFGAKKQDSWRQSKPRRDQDENGSVQDDEWGAKPERPQWANNKRQDSWRQDRPARKRRDEGGDGGGDEGSDTGERSEWGNKKQDSWRQDRFKRRDDSGDGGGDKFRSDGFKKEWRGGGGGGGGDRDFNRNKRDSYKKEGWGDDLDTNSEQGGGRSYKQGRKNNYKQDSWGDSESSWSQKSPKGKDGNEKSWDGRKQNNFAKPQKSDWNSETSFKKVEDPAENTDVYSYPELAGKCEEVLISWFHDPSSFYCQLKQSQDEFRKLVEDIQTWYSKIKSESVPVGSPAIAQYADDKVLYRAYIAEMKGSKYYVHFVDFGNFSTTDKVWPIEKKFMLLPAQALYCSLNGLIPPSESGTWPESGALSSYFDKDSFTCSFISNENNGYFVELFNGDQSINESLVQAGLAKYVDSEIFDPSILYGQQIRVTLDGIEGLDSFNVTLPNSVQVLCTLHNLENATEKYEDTLKQYLGFIVIMYVDNVLEEKIEVTLYDTKGYKINIIEPDEGAHPVIEAICPLPVLSSTLDGWVSEFCTKSLYIQLTEYSQTVADLLDRLFNHYDATTLEEPLKPECEMYYAVHSEDGNWYRGRALDVQESTVTVQYIDYGNSEVVEHSKLRELADEFEEVSMLAVEVTCSTIDESFLGQQVTASIWYGDSGWEGDIQKTISNEVAVEETEHVQSAIQETDVQETDINAETQPDQLLEPIEELNAIGVPVCLSHADSPSEFYLQLQEALDTIDNLQATLQEEVEGYPDLENPGAGILCAAQYSVDQQWYRAQILDADGEITSVRFVDYGNTDTITSHIKTLTSDMLALEQYARRCSLLVKPPEETEWSTNACERFEALTQSEMLSVEIIHQDEKTTFVQLYADGQDVAEILLQEGLAIKLELEVESSCTGYVSNLNSPSEFWIQLENSVADLEWIAEQLTSATNFPELEDLTPGSLCAALYFEDDMWYRARILSNTIAGIEVLFIDYGNSCTCTGLRQLPEDLIMLPPLAQKCSLQKPPGILQWSSQATEEFKTISDEGATVFNIDKLSTGETLIVKLILNSQDVSTLLLPKTESAYITHIDSINDFWLQKISNSTKSDEIAENLTLASDFPVCEVVEVGDLVAALQVEDETWYRAQIVNVYENEYEVLFIDYGNVALTHEIRTLSDDMKYEPLATKHRMEPLPGFRWIDDEATEKLKEISNESSTVFETEFANENVVRLYLNGFDIRSQMDTAFISSVQSSPKKVAANLSIDSNKLVSELEICEDEDDVHIIEQTETLDCNIINSEIENIDNSEIQRREGDTKTSNIERRSSIPISEKIVPGSISRGDLTELDFEDDGVKGAGSPESRSSTPECDKSLLTEELPKSNDNTNEINTTSSVVDDTPRSPLDHSLITESDEIVPIVDSVSKIENAEHSEKPNHTTSQNLSNVESDTSMLEDCDGIENNLIGNTSKEKDAEQTEKEDVSLENLSHTESVTLLPEEDNEAASDDRHCVANKLLVDVSNTQGADQNVKEDYTNLENFSHIESISSIPEDSLVTFSDNKDVIENELLSNTSKEEDIEVSNKIEDISSENLSHTESIRLTPVNHDAISDERSVETKSLDHSLETLETKAENEASLATVTKVKVDDDELLLQKQEDADKLKNELDNIDISKSC